MGGRGAFSPGSRGQWLLPAFLAVASAVSFTTLATLFLIFAGTAQSSAVRTTTAALIAVTSTIAHAFFAPYVLILACATQTITAVLNLLHRVVIVGGPWNIGPNGCRNA
jgi:hypothetical protein